MEREKFIDNLETLRKTLKEDPLAPSFGQVPDSGSKLKVVKDPKSHARVLSFISTKNSSQEQDKMTPIFSFLKNSIQMHPKTSFCILIRPTIFTIKVQPFCNFPSFLNLLSLTYTQIYFREQHTPWWMLINAFQYKQKELHTFLFQLNPCGIFSSGIFHSFMTSPESKFKNLRK